ncbi:hypothetical protein L7E55_07640 [Pelotomaculum isophthalicicum JI]|uniref:Uncharacterized protein n=1 Tax=Pelotomaculum isophthalicicum JI TaxID=947010 RepID=A0A9X4JVY2_9FIRM|nr:hypothetical protein [Pelotomaculum isophthalicicum]MDF9408232.1 hypothetical protein [Pelotomaculum isophthalicicum JI]
MFGAGAKQKAEQVAAGIPVNLAQKQAGSLAEWRRSGSVEHTASGAGT